MKKINRHIEIIITVALCIYIPIIIGMISLHSSGLPFIGSDAIEYRNLSESILNHHSFTQDNIHPEIFRTLGYPLFLAISKSIFYTYWASIFLQLLCTILISILIYKIACRFVSNKIALIPSLFFIIEPSVIIYTITIASDILFTLLFLLSIYLLFFKEVSYKYSVLAGVSLGFATLTRSISLYFIIIAIIFYLIINFNKRDHRKIILNCSIFLFSTILILAPWFIRNYYLFNKVTLSSLPSYNLFHYNLPEYYSYKNNIGVEQARNNLKKELPKPLANSDDLRRGEYMEVLGQISSKHIGSEFFGYTKFHILKTVPFFISSSVKNAYIMKVAILGITESKIEYHNISSTLMKGDYKEFFKILKSEWFVFIERFIWGLLLLFSIFTLFIKKLSHLRSRIILFIVTIFYFAILTGPVSYVRYRLPVEPFIFILSTASLTYIFNKSKI